MVREQALDSPLLLQRRIPLVFFLVGQALPCFPALSVGSFHVLVSLHIVRCARRKSFVSCPDAFSVSGTVL